MTDPVRPLVLTYETKRTGSSIALLRLLQWCVDSDGVVPTFLHRGGGELREEFDRLGPGRLFPGSIERGAHRVLAGRTTFKGLFDRGIRMTLRTVVREMVRRYRTQVIYANTLTHAFLLGAIGDLGIPIVCHVHELDRLIELLIRAEDIHAVFARCDEFFAVSEAVRAMLLRRGVPSDRIHLIPGTVPLTEPLSLVERRRIRHDVFGASDDATLVVACGQPAWVKGTDVFLQTARSALSSSEARESGCASRLRFAWLGATPENRDAVVFRHDVAGMGLDGQVVMLPPVPDANLAVGAADVVLSTSREDANPLVILEAAMQARPIVSFCGAGGVDDLVAAGGALGVPYLDADAMAKAVIRLAADNQAALDLGAAARRYALANGLVENVGPRAVAALRAAVDR